MVPPRPKEQSLAAIAKEISQHVELLKQDHYLDFYSEFFGASRGRHFNVLEVGLYRGGSLLLFGRYLRNARILGIDLIAPEKFVLQQLSQPEFAGRLRVELGSQDDPTFLRGALNEHFGSELLDVVIDDASHLYEQSRTTFETVFHERLRPGGHYVIEDWGAGYWPKWPDGNPDGRHGLPRLIKELIDDVAMADRTLLFEGVRALAVEEEIGSTIRQISVRPSIAVVEKAS